jgi:hypothetical protein
MRADKSALQVRPRLINIDPQKILQGVSGITNLDLFFENAAIGRAIPRRIELES